MESVVLSNHYFTVKINPLGAEMISVFSKSWNRELLWNANPSWWARHAPVLFPIVGKLKNNTITINRKSYFIPQHGFARDQYFEVISSTSTQAVFLLRSSPETLLHFPFHFELQLKYKLIDEKLICEYKVFNPSTETLYYSIGAHPGFNFPFSQTSLPANRKVIFSKQEKNEFLALESGLFTPAVKNHFESDNQTLILKNEILTDNALVLQNVQSDQLVLTDGSQDLIFNWSGFNYFGIWTKDPSANFICLEPWAGLADDENFRGEISEKKGIRKLEKNQIQEYSFSIQIKT